MAIDLQDFKATKYPNLYKSIKAHEKNGFKYLLWAKIDNKLHKKIIGYSKKDNLTDRSANLKADMEKTNIEAGYTSTNKINLDKLFDLYFETLDTSKQWTHKKKYIYNHYIGTSKNDDGSQKKITRKPTEEEQRSQKIFDKNKIGHRKIDSIREMDIQKILNELAKQGLSPRTRKSVMEVLNPLFRFATINKYLRDNPTIGITVKVPSQKKIVTNATDTFKRVYAGINAYYHDNPYYRALFLFGFTGRRKSEILNLKWENIDFTHNYYWIEDTKTDDQQKYQLPLYLIESLQEIKDDRKGLVFKSPITGKKIINIDRQMRQLKKFLAIDNLSMHYMRNILVSTLAEQQVEAITLSGILGHKDANTINKYLSINHYKSSQIGLNKVDDILDVEVME
ncbi:MAG TPA: tyrosine-type recombinase/integrase [Sulfurovum sp.]|nr:tyrosine-type recombinase/integrase [Sulfurovum sp.]HQS77835.1 tyrosine-type recombinase/integrase [Sulfurovum sp.]HQT29139.1 tyrosine-type recombinase/integrase [Sulfurovum sp.]